MLKRMKFQMISLVCVLFATSFLLYSCSGCEEEFKQERLKKEAQKQEQLEKERENNFMEGDKITVKIYTPTGEKSYEGTLVKWWTQGVTIKKDGKTLVGIYSGSYEIERR